MERAYLGRGFFFFFNMTALKRDQKDAVKIYRFSRIVVPAALPKGLRFGSNFASLVQSNAIHE